ncbi:hypothetical protein BAE44_0016410, partial [Dichanthelium oligosanthes]
TTRSYPNRLSNTSSDALSVKNTSVDERKITIILCTKNYCGSHDTVCYCCQDAIRDQCYNTWDECKARCPVCNPECPPPQALPPIMMEGQILHVVKNATL